MVTSVAVMPVLPENSGPVSRPLDVSRVAWWEVTCCVVEGHVFCGGRSRMVEGHVFCGGRSRVVEVTCCVEEGHVFCDRRSRVL